MNRPGRPSVPERNHFIEIEELTPAKGGCKMCVCKHCSRAYTEGSRNDPPRLIQARSRNYRNHLKGCRHYREAHSQFVGATPPSASVGSKRLRNYSSPEDDKPSRKRITLSRTSPPTSAVGHKRSRDPEDIDGGGDMRCQAKRTARALELPSPYKKSVDASRAIGFFKKPTPHQFTTEETWRILTALVELHADNHLSDRFIEQPSTRYFLELLCPGVTSILPSRRVLGGRLLDDHARRCYKKDASALRELQNSGGRVNLLTDVWQNVCKDHLTGCLLTLFGNTLTYALPNAGDRHDGLAIAEQLEGVLIQAQTEGWDVGGMVTDDAGQCKRARDVLTLRWPKIVFLFCFAHDINNLVKQVLKTSFSQITREASAAVNALNGSSSKWLKRARDLMVKMYGYRLSLCSLCVTRWNSMQACFASLLRVQSALQMLTRQSQDDDEFPTALSVFLKDYFWQDLKRAERVIAPLSLASYRLQRDQNTVGDVIKSFGTIYLGFKQAPQHSEQLVACVEQRWKKCEQPLIMLGYALHPRYAVEARKLPVTSVSGIGVLCKFAVYYYRRLISEDIEQLRRDMYRWMKGLFTFTAADEFIESPCEYWQYMADEHPSSKLPDLALKVLSLAVNTATCERLFSDLGLIHTAKRNRMKVSKVLNTEIIAKHVRQRAQKSPNNDPFLKRIVVPDERKIVYEDNTELRLGTPPVETSMRVRTPIEGDDNLEDPGDLADGTETVRLWEDFLDEVFEDDEINAEYTAAETNALSAEAEVNELEAIPEPNKTPFPKDNLQTFPRQTRLIGIRGLNATLAEIFGQLHP